MIIPLDSFDSQVLSAVIEEMVTRDGTDYGEVELSVDDKCEQVLHLLRDKTLFISFDSATETCNLIDAPAARELGLL